MRSDMDQSRTSYGVSATNKESKRLRTAVAYAGPVRRRSEMPAPFLFPMSQRSDQPKGAVIGLRMAALWKLTLLPHLIGRVRLGGGIKGLPTGPLPNGAALANIDRRLVQDRFEPRPLFLWYACRDQRPAAANTFGVKRCLLFRYASLS